MPSVLSRDRSARLNAWPSYSAARMGARCYFQPVLCRHPQRAASALCARWLSYSVLARMCEPCIRRPVLYYRGRCRWSQACGCVDLYSVLSQTPAIICMNSCCCRPPDSFSNVALATREYLDIVCAAVTLISPGSSQPRICECRRIRRPPSVPSVSVAVSGKRASCTVAVISSPPCPWRAYGNFLLSSNKPAPVLVI